LVYRQVLSDIQVEIQNLQTNLLNQKLMVSLDRQIKKKRGNVIVISLRFILTYSVINKSASPGTIEKPDLLIYCPDCDKTRIVTCPRSQKIYGGGIYKTKESATETLAALQLFEKEKIFANTVYLMAGERKNIEEYYNKIIDCQNPKEEALCLIRHRDKFVYKISYLNDKGEKVDIPISNDLICVEHNEF